ncbi:MAG: hypothetical protein GKR95_22085 [Gammaproteobacteria bacterium]|nr:hypothetical protein [Gammaproteobacteria bacterium]
MRKKKTRQEKQKKGFRVADESGIPVPARNLLIEYVFAQSYTVSVEEFCKQFGLETVEEADALESRLSRLTKQKVFYQDGQGKYGIAIDAGIFVGQVMGNAKGYGFVIPDEGDEDLYLNYRQMKKVLHGDRVLVKTGRTDQRGKKEGVIVEVLIDPDREIIGQYFRQGGKGSSSPRTIGMDGIFIFRKN